MCRWLAYSGSPIRLEELLLNRDRSLIDQSLHSRLGATTTNGDGFGVGSRYTVMHPERVSALVLYEPTGPDRPARCARGPLGCGVAGDEDSPIPSNRFCIARAVQEKRPSRVY
jgi:hypothetical protein